MTSYIEMSLEDIIQKKKRENSRNNSKVKKQLPPKKQVPAQKLKIIDARNKIISKKRTQITDAREKLAELAKQKDARLKLQQLRERRQAVPKVQDQVFHRRETFLKTIPRKERVFVDPSRQVTRQPLSHTKVSTRRQINNTSNKIITDKRTVGSRSLASSAPLKPILRTVENDIEIIDEPMEDDHIFRQTALSNRKASLQLKIVTHNHDLRNNRSSTIRRSAVLEKDPSPPRPPSILKKRPMAALRNEKKEEKTEKPVLEYRIIVSNLRNTVTGGDIEELFGDVGGMLESRLVRPGTAEVIYNSIEDAQRAVDLYHNRQLDGQPMNCLLVTPRSTPTNVRTSTKPALYSTNSNVEPDISTFHKVLFSNF
ncbi:unnamed protein product [Parnassius apollo]|uniref:(apollo) hypothetical protein n=1 Tax=Parnassius apollo TaxID=110799 RepID=A0A8S3WZ54_PARAO|nr:unnamed protein product [Parnassius apollo]